MAEARAFKALSRRRRRKEEESVELELEREDDDAGGGAPQLMEQEEEAEMLEAAELTTEEAAAMLGRFDSGEATGDSKFVVFNHISSVKALINGGLGGELAFPLFAALAICPSSSAIWRATSPRRRRKGPRETPIKS